MAILKVHNFGPVANCDILLRRFMVLIGPQSAGKSTLSKLVYYFYHIRDETISHILETLEGGKEKFDWTSFYPRLRRRFVEFWGPTPQRRDVKISFEYAKGIQIDISVSKGRRQNFYNLNFSDECRRNIEDLFNEVKNVVSVSPKSPNLFQTPEVMVTQHLRAELIAKLRESCSKIFNFDKDLLFIPAGRSLLSTLSDQLQYVQPHLLDYPMRNFVERVNSTKEFFNKSLDALIEERRLFWKSDIRLSAINRAKEIIEKVLKAEYRHDQDGGKLYIKDKVFTKINYASSGQQESIWILLSLFLITLERQRALVFVEEPEAHLFPDAQRHVLDLIAFTHNSLGCDYFITTHSPYVLATVNNYVYAHQLGSKNPEATAKVVPSDTWVSSKNVGGYFIDKGKANQLIDQELGLLKTELVDSASEIINDEYEALLDIEEESNSNA